MSVALRLAALLVMLAAAGCERAAPPQPGPPSLDPGTLEDADPDTYEAVMRTLEGEPVVVNYWATWCAPCKEEMPRLVAAAGRYEGRVRFLGVNVEDVADEARAFIDEQRIPFASLSDPGGDIKKAQGVLGLPSTEFYGADGELVYIHRGEISAEELERRIEELLRVGVPATPPG